MMDIGYRAYYAYLITGIKERSPPQYVVLILQDCLYDIIMRNMENQAKTTNEANEWSLDKRLDKALDKVVAQLLNAIVQDEKRIEKSEGLYEDSVSETESIKK